MKQPQAHTINLQTAFAIAFAAHVVFIAALAFTAPTPEANKTLEVTFNVKTSNKNAPKDAKHIASQNQEASGTVTSDATPTTQQRSEQAGDVVQETQQRKLQQVKQNSAQQIVTTKALKDQKAVEENKLDNNEHTGEGLSAQEQREAEIRALEATIAKQDYEYSQRPTIHRFTSVAAIGHEKAEYEKQWKERVESIGNANYPKSAVNQGLVGDVTLKVTQYKSGALKKIEILRSSGHKLLDEAAKKSVELSAPFPPYNVKNSRKQDLLEFYRTWQFRNNSITTIGY